MKRVAAAPKVQLASLLPPRAVTRCSAATPELDTRGAGSARGRGAPAVGARPRRAAAPALGPAQPRATNTAASARRRCHCHRWFVCATHSRMYEGAAATSSPPRHLPIPAFCQTHPSCCWPYRPFLFTSPPIAFVYKNHALFVHLRQRGEAHNAHLPGLRMRPLAIPYICLDTQTRHARPPTKAAPPPFPPAAERPAGRPQSVRKATSRIIIRIVPEVDSIICNIPEIEGFVSRLSNVILSGGILPIAPAPALLFVSSRVLCPSTSAPHWHQVASDVSAPRRGVQSICATSVRPLYPRQGECRGRGQLGG